MAATARQQAVNQLYANLMDEAKVRMGLTEGALNGRLMILPAALVREFGFLQLRLLCELIALACLIAHGDIKETQSSKMKQEYAADKVIDALTKLHPNFYPRPITVYGQHEGPPSLHRDSPGIHFETRSCDFLTKEELPKLYGICGDFLHRGTLKKLASSRSPEQMQFAGKDFAMIRTYLNKITQLLATHIVSSLDNYEHVLCTLNDPTRLNGIMVAIASAPRPQQS